MKPSHLSWARVACVFLTINLSTVSTEIAALTSVKSGAVYTREIVRENGNPIFVEYDAQGNEVVSGQSFVDTPEVDYWVLSADRYRALLAQYQDLVDYYGDHGLSPPELMAKESYLSASFNTLGGAVIPKPALREDTVTVALAPSDMRYSTDASKLLLLELPIDPTISINSDSNSLLINRDDGSIIHQTQNNIGYRVGFYGDGSTVSSSTVRKSTDQIYGPLAHVPVEMVSFASNPVPTNDQGKYTLPYRIPSCLGFSYEMNSLTAVKLEYKRFNPLGSPTRPYYLFNWGIESCYGYMEVSPMAAFSMANNVIYGVEGVSDTIGTVTRKVDFPIDIMVLSGRAALVNTMSTGFNTDGTVPIGAQTRFDATRGTLTRVAQQNYDLDGDGQPDTSVLGRVVTDEAGSQFYKSAEGETPTVQGVWLSSLGAAASFDETSNQASRLPDLTRVPDWSADVDDHALLSSISAEDLADTDLYVFRESDGSLLMERKGLNENEKLIGVDESVGQFVYTLRLVGSRGRLVSGSVKEGDDAEFRQWQLEEGVVSAAAPQYQRKADHLRPGEAVRIIAINRASGYLGSISETLEATSAGSGDLDISFDVRDIQLLPPNLKIWAERKSRRYLNISDEEIRNNLIGNEGAGMSDDQYIVIYTEWLDPEGLPLPDALKEYGYTGRLAKVNLDGKLVAAHVSGDGERGDSADSVSNFKIKPGLQLQLMRLPEAVASQQHYYVQVNGQPNARNPSFENVGANGGVLAKRPNKFVPIKTPFYDEELSNQLKQATAYSASAEPQPVYQWGYRPDYQFSVYELMVWETIRTDMWQQSHSLIEAESPTLQSTDVMFGMLYDLNRSDNPLPDAYSYEGERELVFSLEGEEVSANLGYGQTVEFEDPIRLAELAPEDHLTLRLYSNNDAANILWEYEIEASSVILHSIAQGDPAKGKRRAISMLDDSYFFTSLGHKKVFIHKAGFGANDKVKVLGVEGGKFDTYPAVDTDISFSNGYAMFLLLNKKGDKYVTPDTANPDKAYKVTFLVTPDQSVPEPEGQSVETAHIVIKNNSNTSLEEVVAGRAVWARNPAGIADADADKFRGKTKHDGSGVREQLLSEQYVDYGQYLMNMVAIPLMTPVRESNFKYVTTPDGMYGPATENFLKAYVDTEFNEALNNFESNDRFAIKGVVSHHDNEQNLIEGASQHLDPSIPYRSFRKLIQDYQATVPASAAELGQQIMQELGPTTAPGLSYTSDGGFDVETFKTLRHRIITPEVMRGQVFNPTEGRTIAADGEFTDEDLGIYELYLSYDWDGDGVSNFAEVENATLMTLNDGGTITNDGSNLFNPLNATDSNYGEVLKLATAAGFNEMQGFSGTPPLPVSSANEKKGPGLIVSGNQHVHGMRFPTFAPGIYDLGGNESQVEPGEVNIDNYAVPSVVKIVEDASREYSKIEADVYPLEKEPAIHAAALKQTSHLGFRMGMNDASIPGGGMVGSSNWSVSLAERAQGLSNKHYLAHVSHQNGMDIDLRFMTNVVSGKRVEKVVNFADNPADFDYDATLRLLQKIYAAAHANGYRVSKLFAGDTVGTFPSNLPPDLEVGELRNFERFCDAVDLPVGDDCAETVKPHRHHIHLRFEPEGGRAYALQMANQNHEVNISIPVGATDVTQTYSFDVQDTLGRPAVTYTRLHFLLYNEDGSMAANDNNGVLSVGVPAEYNSVLYINPINQVATIGQAELSITCYQASANRQLIYITGHPIPSSNVAANALGTISVQCNSVGQE